MAKRWNGLILMSLALLLVASGLCSAEERGAVRPFSYQINYGDPYPALFGATLSYHIREWFALGGGIGGRDFNQPSNSLVYGVNARFYLTRGILSPLVGVTVTAGPPIGGVGTLGVSYGYVSLPTGMECRISDAVAIAGGINFELTSHHDTRLASPFASIILSY